MSIVRQPRPVPIIDAIKTGCIIQAIVAFRYGSQVSSFKHVKRGDTLEMDRIVIVVGSERPRGEQRHRQIEEPAVGGRV